MGKKSDDDEYQEAMRLAAQYRESKKSAWSPAPRPQRNPNERAQYVEKSIFGSENRYDGRAASRASKKGKR